MKDTHSQQDASIDQDPVWKLLEQSQSRAASPRFTDQVVRLARLDVDESRSCWSRWFAPMRMGACTGVAAAMVIGFFALRSAPDVPLAVGADVVEEANFAHIQEVLEVEMLFAAVEYMDAFSDEELVALIGF